LKSCIPAPLTDISSSFAVLAPISADTSLSLLPPAGNRRREGARLLRFPPYAGEEKELLAPADVGHWHLASGATSPRTRVIHPELPGHWFY